MFTLPHTRRDFWQAKIDANRQRDLRNVRTLMHDGWSVICIWECAIRGRLRRDSEELAGTISAAISQQRTSPGLIEFRHRCLPEDTAA